MAQLGFVTESTAGQTLTPTKFMPFLEESLVLNSPIMKSDGIRAAMTTRHQDETNGGLHRVEGSTSFDLSTKGVSVLFKHLFGQVSTSGAGPYEHTYTPATTHDGVALTLQVGVDINGSATVQPKTITGAKPASWQIQGQEDAFVTLGIDWLGQRLEIGSRTVADGATTNATTTLTSATGAFSVADEGKSLSGTGIPAGTYVAEYLTSTTVRMSQAASATGSSLSVVIGKALATASYPSALHYFKMHHCSATIAGSSVPIFGFTLNGTNPLVPRFAGGSRWSSEIRTDANVLREYTGSLNLEYASNTQWDRYRQGDPFALVLNFVSGTDTIVITMNARYDEGLTPQSGRGATMLDAPFEAFASTNDASAISCVITTGEASAA